MGRLTHTVNGDVASFRSASRVPIESLKFHFLPKQASGTPSPENPIPIEGWTGLNGRRAGKNLLNFNKGLYNNPFTSGGITFTVYYNDDGSLSHINVKGSKTGTNVFYNLNYKQNAAMIPGHYVVSGMVAGKVEIRAYEYNPNETCILATSNGTYDFIAHEGASKSWIRLQVITNEYIDENIYPMLMMYPCSDNEYEPYSEEQIPITFPTNGKNLADDENAIASAKNMTKVGDRTYTNTIADTKSSVNLYIVQYDKDYKVLKTDIYYGSVDLGRNSKTFATVKNCSKVLLKHNGSTQDLGVFFPWDGRLGTYTISANFTGIDPTTIGGFAFSDVQIELGDTATTYEPYSSDNTFYGGYVDPVAGEIVAEYALAVAKKENFGEKVTPPSGRMEYRQTGNIYSPTESGVTWSVARQQQKFNFGVIANPWSETAYGNNIGVIITQGNYNMTYMRISETVYQAMGDDDLATISYKLETPIHIPIPAEDMKAFLDHNNFWSDANDVTEVTYPVTESRDILATRKRIMSQTWDMIPLKYQPVEYISAKDSNPYIDMGIKFTGELEAEVHYYNDKREAFLFGSRKGASSTPYCNFNVESPSSSSAGRSRFDYGNQKATAGSGLPFAGYHDGEYIFKFHGRTATMEKVSTGEIVTKDYSSFTRTDYSDCNMYLFSVNTNGTASLNTGTGELRVYSAKFWLGGQLVRDFVPCVRKSDSKPGMYDRVSKTFFINVGSDEFVIPT